MSRESLPIIQFVSAVLLLLPESWLLWHNLVHSKPYKIIYLDGYYERLGHIGVPTSFVLAAALLFLIREQAKYLLPPIAGVLLPLLLWFIYQISFLIGGHDANFDGGGFSTLSAEMDLAYELVRVMSLTVVVGGAIAIANKLLFDRRG